MEARPYLPARPCPACGAPVDPLRAAEVVLLEDGYRFLCGRPCRGRFLSGDRAHDRPPPAEPERPRLRRDPTTGRIRTHDPTQLEPLVGERPPPPAPTRPPWEGAAAALAGLLLGAVADRPALVAGSALASLLAVGLASRASLRDGVVPEALFAPLGAGLSIVAALLLGLDGADARVGLAASALASAALVSRAYVLHRARRPVALCLHGLGSGLPRRARVAFPEGDGLLDVSFTEVDARDLRAADEVLVVEGETVGVDGIVRAGEALVLTHARASAPVRVEASDGVLAGARLVEGALRVEAVRVGAARAVVAPAAFGDAAARGGGGPSRAARLATSVGGGLVLLLAAAMFTLLSGGEGGAGLFVAAALLLSVPLASIRRGTAQPLVAGTAAAAERGIVFASPLALELSARAAVAALVARGTVTEGVLEVVETQGVRGSGPSATDVRFLLACALGAEVAAADHPIAQAIARYAEAEGVAPESVRRATHLPGLGVTALAPGGEPFVLGNRRLLLAEGVSVAVADAEAARAEARGHTALFMGLGGHVRAVISLRDDVRPGARAAVQRLFDLGMEVVLLSGDHRPAIEGVARGLDVAHVRSDLLPEEEGAAVRRLKETGGAVAVIGRMRDEAAFGAADAAIVLGAAGQALGERAVMVTTPDVRDAAAALFIAKSALRHARRALLVLAGGGGLVVVAVLMLALPGYVSALPGVAALLCLLLEVAALPAAARLLRQIERREPPRV